MSKQLSLIESTKFGSTRVDREAGVIHGVKFLNEKSINGFDYPTKTRQAAIPLFEGAKINIDHVSKTNIKAEVPLSTRFGIARNVVDNGQGTLADLHFIKSHPMAETICEMAEKFPELLGMSIRALGSPGTSKTKGRKLVESIDLVQSIDIVADPAATLSLFESKNMDEPAADPVLDGFCEMVSAVVKDAEMDIPAKMKKIKDILKAHEKLSDKPEEEVKADEKPEPMAESVDLQKRIDELLLEKDCRLLIESVGMPVENEILSPLMLMAKKEDRQSFLTFLRKKLTAEQPKSGSATMPLIESINHNETKEKEMTTRLVNILRS